MVRIELPEICTWIDAQGGYDVLTIENVFTIVDSYLFNIPPAGYTFIPTLQNVFGVIDYYLGFNGDAGTGCSYYDQVGNGRVENLTSPSPVHPFTPFDVEYDCLNIGTTDMIWGHIMDRDTGFEITGSRWEEEITADGTKHVIAHFEGISVDFNGQIRVGHIPRGLSKRYIVDYVVDIGK